MNKDDRGNMTFPALLFSTYNNRGKSRAAVTIFTNKTDFSPLQVCLTPNSRLNFVPVSRGLRKRHDLIYSAVTKPAAKRSNEIALGNLGRTAKPVNDGKMLICRPKFYEVIDDENISNNENN